ncbi:NAD(P)-dependent oxidoreductase [Helicobacter anseris]|uniref:NAD(P)-dependent oxidoreductase n=1 Tax=Helicobacter anseris TaxID=375926 RepID=A0A3D8J8V7_9HELI|nr:NAD-dependent epimerase/dehydratase family protein [Helicobacter anseris]RDU73858.1 NAD(P)-dependent oxidoreductase [Helicobacter anseris]
MQTILVTGATGFLGTEVCKHLLSLGYQVIGVGRKKYGFLPQEVINHPSFYFKQLELKNLDEKTFQNFDIDSCIHLASMVEYASHDYHDYHDYTITPTLNLLKLAKSNKLQKIIYSSTFSVLANSPSLITSEETPVNPNTNYGLSKYICEKLLEIECLKNPSLSCIVLRFPAIYGVNHLGGIIHTLKEEIINNNPIELYGEGKYKRNVLYVQDAVNAIISTLHYEKKGYELFGIGAKESLSVLEIAQKLKALLDSQSEIILSPKKSPNNFDTQIDTTKAQKMLNFTPQDIVEGLKKYTQEIKEIR